MSAGINNIKSRAEWLGIRKTRIGASDAGAILGVNSWKNNVQLWREKMGIEAPEDISGKPAVQYGIAAEPLIRAMFELDHPELRVSYRDFDMLESAERPWQVATLDGRLERENGELGVLEIKTARIASRLAANAWDGQIPQGYFAQITHQLAVTKYTFAIMRARLIFTNRIEERDYMWEAADLMDDIAFLNAEEDRFYSYIQSGTEPPLKLASGW